VLFHFPPGIGNQYESGIGTHFGSLKLFEAEVSSSSLLNGRPTTQMTDGGLKGADDQGIDKTVRVALNASSATFASTMTFDANNNSIGFARPPQQILSIVTGVSPAAASGNNGMFFPSGLNGNVN
jgi:hypothetical protein